METKICYYLDEVEKMQDGEYVNPVSCEIDLSNKCMLDCYYCMYKNYRKKNLVNLSENICRRLFVELRELGVKSLTFTGGGEPLMAPFFNNAVSLALYLGFEVGLITNGVKLMEVSEPEKFKFIRVSVDAVSPETYCSIKGKNVFFVVMENIRRLIDRKIRIGVSFVVCKENQHEMEKAEFVFTNLGVDYIQFKPAWVNGESYKFSSPPKLAGKTIITERHKAENHLPCQIAGLVGIVGADANVYFCCQHRGEKQFKLGSLKDYSFRELWERRINIKFDIAKCPQCRYMNYAKEYINLVKGNKLFFIKHKYFL